MYKLFSQFSMWATDDLGGLSVHLYVDVCIDWNEAENGRETRFH